MRLSSWTSPRRDCSEQLYILRSAKKCRSCILGLCFCQFAAGVLQICCTGTAVDTFSPRTRYCTSLNILRTIGEYRLWDSCGSVRVHTPHQIPGISLKIDKNASSPKCKDDTSLLIQKYFIFGLFHEERQNVLCTLYMLSFAQRLIPRAQKNQFFSLESINNF
jgi:hypothetical protein